ncbi:ornithine carbamoyltransferase [Alkalicoccobacillus plakortidis]|uniref:Ornithine carbamoyltransferase n=1 Tax=Alkalicoccobacillus plakortidis TaxID=444060 RepID=A0ABT0XGU4_9BACI|nr:ornithine carbamoyltransferase [Alkalicoccobacillus plakortidis]MCM2675097.1 ornithine carbamoyltransferase [Alkalicoccobacillus plakortidis]
MTHSLQVSAEKMTGRDFLTLFDYSPEEINQLLQAAKSYKENPETKKGVLAEKSLGMIFENASTRTRVSFEVGLTQMGGHALFLSPRDLQIGRGEPVKDTAQVLSRYLDAIMIRTNSHELVEEFAHYATVPVINALTDAYHPCQAVADLLTILEQKQTLQGLKLAYFGDGNNVAHSLLVAGAKMGMHVVLATPAEHKADQKIVARVKEIAKQTGAIIEETEDSHAAATDADVIYTDVWASMGFEEEQTSREQTLSAYQVNEELLASAKSDYMFLHCLPAHRGEEVTAEVIDGTHSYVYDQAENRLHAQQAILAALIG